MGSRSRDMPLSEPLGVLGSGEKDQREFGAVTDLRYPAGGAREATGRVVELGILCAA